jgi:Txe/YoeB family toxin of toxin-antitoxin system
MEYKIVFSKQASKDAKLIIQAGLKNNVDKLLDILKINPFQNPPSYEKLKSDLNGFYSRRINIRHRLVYQVYDKEKTVKILRMWTHYE